MKKYFGIFAVAAMITLGACGSTAVFAGSDQLFNIVQVQGGWSSPTVYILTDSTTGVEYIVVEGFRERTMSPRYNADGSLYTSNK